MEALGSENAKGSSSVSGSTSLTASSTQIRGASMTMGDSSSIMTAHSTYSTSMAGNTSETPNVIYQEKEVSITSLNATDLLESLRIMESAVLETTYATRLLEYRDLQKPSLSELKEDSFEAQIPSLHYLWSFRCDIVRERAVAALSWNKQNQDILAVGYGASRVTDAHLSPGLICCWSLKNPEHPGRIYPCESPVTSLDFSNSSPNLLCVGFADGRIAIYDVRSEDNIFVDSASLVSKHHDPVWQIKWIEREQSLGDERNQAEAIVSISTDGRVCQWLLRKGLESQGSYLFF
ncbi:WD repeat-containing protein 78 [Coelomomyces lativittatus]|nr:WD repeat-containing protein 78 [Coelomomyces lativittatus]